MTSPRWGQATGPATHKMNKFEHKGHKVEVLKIRRWKPWTHIIDESLSINRFATANEAIADAKLTIDKAKDRN